MKATTPFLIVALVSGVLFGLGLSISGMVNPARVLGFLDITGTWDPTLAFVMGGALLVTLPAFQWVRTLAKPAFATTFVLPTRKDLDWRLLAGAGLFGIGWGLAGLCPGPALVGLITLQPNVLLFVMSMLSGMLLYQVTLE
jgi:uncharacterized protein